LLLVWAVLYGNSLAMEEPIKRDRTNPFAKYIEFVPNGRMINYPAMEADRPLTSEQKARLSLIHKNKDNLVSGGYSTVEGRAASYECYCRWIMHGATMKQTAELDGVYIERLEKIILELCIREVLKGEDFADRNDILRIKELAPKKK
jgi:hypothetical protein